MKQPYLFLFILILLGSVVVVGQVTPSTADDALPPPRDPAVGLEFLPRLEQATESDPKTYLSLTPEQRIPWSKLVYQSLRDGNWEIYSGNDDGSGQARLTAHGASDIHPRFDRGANRIVFASNRSGSYELHRMNADGTAVTQLTFTGANNVNPAWSPDGNKIAFESYRDGQAEIYVMNADGSNQARLTTQGEFDGMPAWSPDGSKIAFSSRRSGDYRIWVMNADGGNQVQLPSQPGSVYPAWSPDGSKIAFSADAFNNGFLSIWQVNVAGSEQEHLYTPGGQRDAWVKSWSPDGRFLTFTQISFIFFQGNWYWTEAYLDAFDTITWGNVIRLSASDVEWHPDWQTLDAEAPTAAVHALPAQSPGPIPVNWSGTDEGGSGIKSYDIQVRVGVNGAWANWLINTTSSSDAYPGVGGQTYFFRGRARDNAFNTQPWPANAQASTTVESQPPISWIEPLPAFRRADDIEPGNHNLTVHWNGYDPGGSGIATYDVQVRDGAGAWTNWQTDTTATTGGFGGQAGHTYYFRVRAKDKAQNPGNYPSGSDHPATTFYSWAVSGRVTDNAGAPVVQALPATEPEALAILPTSSHGGYASYFAGSGPYQVGWQKDGYAAIPHTPFYITDGLAIVSDSRLDIVLPPADNIVADWGFESGDITAGNWTSAGVYSATITAAGQHSGNFGVVLGPASLFSDPITVSTADTFAREPQIAIDQQNNLHMIWRHYVGDDSAIYYRQRNSNGVWSPPQNISGVALWPSDQQLVVDNNGIVHVIWQHSSPESARSLFYARRDIAGAWSSPQKLSANYYPQEPHLAVGSNGIPHVVFSHYAASIYHTQGTINGSWSTPEQVSDSHSTEPKVAVDGNGNAHIVWRENIERYPDPSNTVLHYRRKQTNGAWTATQIVSQNFKDVHQPILWLGPSNIMHLVWLDGYADSGQTLRYARLSGNSWTFPEEIPTIGSYVWYINARADQFGNIHILWSSAIMAERNIFYVRRTDGGWSAPQNISESALNSGGLGTVMDGNDRLIVIWIEAREWENRTPFVRLRWREPDGKWSQIHSLAEGIVQQAVPLIAVDSNNRIHLIMNPGPADYSEATLLYTTEYLAPTTGHSAIAQAITLPASLATPTLSFLYNLQGAAAANGTTFSVRVQNESGVTTLLSTSNNTAGWQHHWIDLNPWAGQSISLTFTLAQTAGKPMARLYLDEITVGSTYPDLWVRSVETAALPGKQVVYTLEYGNQGGAAAAGAQISHTLPAGFTFINATVSPVATSPALVWELGTLAAKSETYRIVITAMVPSTAVTFATVSGPVAISSTITELETSNNSATASIFIGSRVYLPLTAR